MTRGGIKLNDARSQIHSAPLILRGRVLQPTAASLHRCCRAPFPPLRLQSLLRSAFGQHAGFDAAGRRGRARQAKSLEVPQVVGAPRRAAAAVARRRQERHRAGHQGPRGGHAARDPAGRRKGARAIPVGPPEVARREGSPYQQRRAAVRARVHRVLLAGRPRGRAGGSRCVCLRCKCRPPPRTDCPDRRSSRATPPATATRAQTCLRTRGRRSRSRAPARQLASRTSCVHASPSRGWL